MDTQTADKDLFQAVSEGSEKSALKLLQEANKKFSQKVLDDSLLETCRQGNRILVEALVSFGANIHSVTKYGWTPLLFAADFGNLDVLRVLLQKGADVNAVNVDGDTALNLTIRPVKALQYMYIQQMIEGGEIDINDEISSRYCEDSPSAVEMVKMLIEKGVNINQKNFTGLSPLMAAAQIKKSLSVLEILLLNGASVNAKDDRGNTALMHAIKSDCTENADFLLKQKGHQKVDFELQNTLGLNALISAIKHNNTAIIDLLLVCGANVNVEDNSGDTALTWAARKGDVDMVKKIIERGGNVNHQNKEGYSALMFSAAQKSSDIITTLLHHSADINAQDIKGNTALIHAVENRHTETAKLLIEYEGDQKVDFEVQNNLGSNALISAVKHGNDLISDLLITHGVNVNVRDNDKETAMTWAARNNERNTLKKLIERGADVNHQNKEGFSALMLAAEDHNYAFMKTLLKAGANINAVSQGREKKTAVSLLYEMPFDFYSVYEPGSKGVHFMGRYFEVR